MANPFLVLGGVAVGVVTAGIGVLQVPGWIDSANDSAATSDLSQVALAQEGAITVAGKYTSLADLKLGKVGGATGVDTGVKIQESAGVKNAVAVNTLGDKWVAVSVSKSGNVFVRTSDSTTVYKSNAKLTGAIAASSFTGLSLPTGFTIGGTITAPTATFAVTP